MPRGTRVFVAGGVDHIYCRVGRGEFIFNEPGEADRGYLLALPRLEEITGLSLTLSPVRVWRQAQVGVPEI